MLLGAKFMAKCTPIPDYIGVAGELMGFRRPVWLLCPGKWIHLLRFPCCFWQSPLILP